MTILIIVSIVLALYAIVVLVPSLFFVLKKQRSRKLFIPKTFISILIPVRNEEENISECLESVLKLDYPKELFEIIIIDDHSTDKTNSIAEKFLRQNSSVSIIENNGIGKKSALTCGVKKAKGKLIVTTDGDCMVPENWLRSIAEVFENENPVFIAGPVTCRKENNFLQQLLQMEQICLQIISAGSMMMNIPMMCSGANLAYTKEFFLQVNGYEKDEFASGDDMMLMVKAKKMFPGKLRFIKSKNAIVKTRSAKSLKEAVQQRSRWISKFSGYKSFVISFVGILVFLCNAAIFSLGALSIFENSLLMAFIFALVGKMVVDLLLLSLSVPFFREPRLLLLAPIGEIFYPLLAVFSVIARGTGSYKWKGREWKK